MQTKFMQVQAMWVQTQWKNPGCHCINCENLLTTVTQTPASDVSNAVAVYFQGNIVQSLLVGEEFEEKTQKEVTSILKAAVDQKVIKMMTISDAIFKFLIFTMQSTIFSNTCLSQTQFLCRQKALFMLSFL